jgi:alpha-beta hydrolase superfamily lysophospholipase
VTAPPPRNVVDFFETDRLRFAYRAWLSPDPLAHLLIVHGLSDHSGRYESIGRAFAAMGVSSWAFDLRGHGRSAGRRGHASGFSRLLEDVDAFRALVAATAGPGAPLFLLGHSLGGLVGIRYVQEYPDAVRGAIIVSPWLGTALAVPRWKTGLAAGLSRLLPALPFAANVPEQHLSRDPAVGKAYREDPLVHDTITPRLFVEVQAAMKLAVVRAAAIRPPLLVLLAGADRIVDTERALLFARAARGGRAEIRRVDGAYHEILNEPDAARHIAAIGAWIRARVHPAPG